MSSFLTRLKITLGRADADAEALEALQTDTTVQVVEGDEIVFRPAATEPELGVVFYPGGRCDPRAYAPLLRPLAAAGCLVVVPHMRLRLAVLDAQRATRIVAARPGIARWAVGGHSMGGAMAAAWAYKHPDATAGLFLVASYPAAMHSMTDRSLPVLVVSGTRDTIIRASELAAAPGRLPADTHFVAIDGGDHYQFGSFANAPVTATLPRTEQHRQTVAALQDFLANL